MDKEATRFSYRTRKQEIYKRKARLQEHFSLQLDNLHRLDHQISFPNIITRKVCLWSLLLTMYAINIYSRYNAKYTLRNRTCEDH